METETEMYSRIDPSRLPFEIEVDEYVASLAARHAGLEKAIEEETRRPAPDGLSLSDLKRRKLRIKDEIAGLHREAKRAAQR